MSQTTEQLGKALAKAIRFGAGGGPVYVLGVVASIGPLVVTLPSGTGVQPFTIGIIPAVDDQVLLMRIDELNTWACLGTVGGAELSTAGHIINAWDGDGYNDLPQRGRLDISIAGGPMEGTVVFVTDNPDDDATNIALLPPHRIQDESSDVTDRPYLSFVGDNVEVTDDSDNGKTVVTISGAAGSFDSDEDPLGSDTALANGNSGNWTDLCSLTLASGTWFVWGYMTGKSTNTIQAIAARLRDTTNGTTYAQVDTQAGGNGYRVNMSFARIVTHSGTTTYKLQGQTETFTSADAVATTASTSSDAGPATNLLAFRVI